MQKKSVVFLLLLLAFAFLTGCSRKYPFGEDPTGGAMNLYWYQYRPDVTDSSGERAAAENDKADYGECPADYEKEVSELALLYLGLEGLEGELVSKTIHKRSARKPKGEIYIDPIPLYRAKASEEVFGWKGHLALRYWDSDISDWKFRVFSFYIRKGCDTLYLQEHGRAIKSVNPVLDDLGIPDFANGFTELPKLLIDLGTLGMANDNLTSSFNAGRAITTRAMIMQEAKKRRLHEHH